MLLTIFFTSTRYLRVEFTRARNPTQLTLTRRQATRNILAISRGLLNTARSPILNRIVDQRTTMTIRIIFTSIGRNHRFDTRIIDNFRLRTQRFRSMRLSIITRRIRHQRPRITTSHSAFTHHHYRLTGRHNSNTFNIKTTSHGGQHFHIAHRRLSITKRFRTANNDDLRH